MIIEALYDHYKTLSNRPDSGVPEPGFAVLPVAFAFNLSPNGDLLDVIPLGDRKGKRILPIPMMVPEPVKRAGSGVAPSFLCDNSMYIIGADEKGKPDRSVRAFEASREFHLEILQHVADDAAQAVCQYFRKWNPNEAREHAALEHALEDVLAGRNIVFRFDGSDGYVHDRPKIREAWLRHRDRTTPGVTAQCLVTGEVSPIARIHPSIKGVRGAQSMGAALSSYNLKAFESYGKSQNYNAPLSEAVAFGYTTALNHMLASNRQRLQLDTNTTVVFWSDRQNGEREENLMAELFDLSDVPESDGNPEPGNGRSPDLQTTQLVRDVLDNVRRGRPIDFDAVQVDPESRFFVLGLSPNSSRLSVRFWQADTFGRMVQRVAQHHVDMAITPPNYRTSEFISVREILRETAPLGDWERIPPVLGGALMRAILTGQPYPQGLYTALIARVRADSKDRINYVRAAMIKAALLRRIRAGWRLGRADHTCESQEVTITVSLDVNNKAPAYLLGRLFAVLEKVQQDANPGTGLNATIRDRYFGAASATPRAVFPQLLRLAQHHISKAEYGRVSDHLIESIVVDLVDFPAHLTLDEQGLFMLGYYHQRQAFYQKAEDKE